MSEINMDKVVEELHRWRNKAIAMQADAALGRALRDKWPGISIDALAQLETIATREVPGVVDAGKGG